MIEKWGRGTNRVIAMCREAGISSPTFEEITGAAVVTFKVNVLGVGRTPIRPGEQVGTKSGLSRDQVEILRLCRQEQPLVALMKAVGRQNRTKFRDGFVKPLVDTGLLELTVPDKPRSRLQKYRTTPAGERALKESGGENG